MMSATPIIKEQLPGRVQRLNTFLDEHLLPYPVRFLTNRVIILATLALLIPLLFFTSDQAFVNALNSYLNVMSVVVSSTVLLYATIADVRDRAAAKRAEELGKAYEQLLEERVQGREELAKAYEQKLEKRVQGREQELEERVQGREELAKAYEQELEQRVQEREQELEKRVQKREELAKAYEQKLEQRLQADHELIEQILQNSIENILGGRLEKIRLEDHKKLEDMQKAVIASNETLRLELAEKARLASNESLLRELAELRELVQALHQSRFGKPEDSEG
jgi:flagellar biosynthesis GTPase FlhF